MLTCNRISIKSLRGKSITHSVQLCVVIDEEDGQLRVVKGAVGSGNEDATLEPDGIVVEWAVGGSLGHTVGYGARLVNAEAEELGARGLGPPRAGATLLIVVGVTVLVVLLAVRVRHASIAVVVVVGGVGHRLLGLVRRLSRGRLVCRVALLSRLLRLVLRRLRRMVLSGLSRMVFLCRVVTREYGRGASQAKETECQEVSLHLEMSEWERVSGMNVVDEVDGRCETPTTRMCPIYGE